MKVIARRTFIWLALAVVSTAILSYRIYDFRRTCSEYLRSHEVKAKNPPQSDPNANAQGPVFVYWDPCSYEDPSQAGEQILTLIAVVSVPVFLAASRSSS